MFYKFTFKPIVIKAPTEQDAWDKLFDEYYIVDPEDVEIEVECLGERMKGKNMDEERIKLIDELMEKVKEQSGLISELAPFIVAYKYCLESFESERERLEHDIELMELDLKEGERGYGLQRKYFQAGQRRKYLSETLCFMRESIDRAKAGDIE